MTVAGDFPAIIKIIENAELQCELVLVGSDLRAIHRER